MTEPHLPHVSQALENVYNTIDASIIRPYCAKRR